MKFRIVALLVLLFGLLAGCSTLKALFSPQGQKLSAGKDYAAKGQMLAASASAAEALAIEPEYKAAQESLETWFAPGQEEFRTEVARWNASDAVDRWDRLYELYQWQDTLATVLPTLKSSHTVAAVKDDLEKAGAQASVYHFDLASKALAAADGPRQARKALAQGLVAQSYSASTPGLSDWLQTARSASQQRLMIIPFFFDPHWMLGSIANPLASQVESRLQMGQGLPDMTSVFSVEKLGSLPGGGPARVGLISRPDAVRLALAAGQNLLLIGEITQALYIDPRRADHKVTRQATSGGKTWVAEVTTTDWTSSVQVGLTFHVIEVGPNRELGSDLRQARASETVSYTTFVGDQQALTPDDLRAIAKNALPVNPRDLLARVLQDLSSSVADSVRILIQ